ncbi:class I SAM-dependent methyltransferase, partial [bacterium]|nr:class I SAM-dependent methyltransferase [bacterium]
MSTTPNISFGRRLLPQRWHQRLQFDRHEVVRFVGRHLPADLAGRRILDAGSGSAGEQHFRDQLARGQCHACDIAARPGVDYLADLQQLPIRDSSYDLALCTQVLEHVPQPARACQELFRILKPGGHLLVTVPQSAFLHDLPHHYFNHTCFGLRRLLETAGFEVVVLEPQGGHFLHLGTQLHYTVQVIKAGMTTPTRRILLFPLLLLVSALFGFLTKLVCLWL